VNIGSFPSTNPIVVACLGVAPAFNCPIFEGPTVINRQWFEFYCTVDTSETDLNARFEVVFLFNGLPAADVPPFIATVDNKTAVLHEQYISGKTGQSVCMPACTSE
jgi:hypothetical protein